MIDNRFIPKTLMLRGNLLTFAGRGWSPGAVLFTMPGKGTVEELYPARLVSLDGRWLHAAAQGNLALDRIQVPREAWAGNRAPALGDEVLVGPVRWPGQVATADGAWLLAGAPAARPAPVRPALVGTLTEFHPDRGYGRLIDDQGRSVFVHRNQVAPGTPVVVGARYRFRTEHKDRGLSAVDVRAA